MNLIVDIGNTVAKIAVFADTGIVEVVYDSNAGLEHLLEVCRRYSCDKAIVATVIDLSEQALAQLASLPVPLLWLDEKTPLPVENLYETPRTLGYDRMAAVVGANEQFPGRDLLVIDAGTAITYELIDASGSYLGGNISPGMTTRFRALNLFTEKLTLVVEQEYIPLVGTDTETAIQAGVVNGIVCEMDGYIEMLRLKYPNLLVFLTGGHSFYFERRLKNSIFADINLVLTGLNRILEYNVEN